MQLFFMCFICMHTCIDAYIHRYVLILCICRYIRLYIVLDNSICIAIHWFHGCIESRKLSLCLSVSLRNRERNRESVYSSHLWSVLGICWNINCQILLVWLCFFIVFVCLCFIFIRTLNKRSSFGPFQHLFWLHVEFGRYVFYLLVIGTMSKSILELNYSVHRWVCHP